MIREEGGGGRRPKNRFRASSASATSPNRHSHPRKARSPQRESGFLRIFAPPKPDLFPIMLRKYLFFDLDGTLTDPMEGITRSVEYALRHFGIEVADRRELCPFIGPPLADSFRERYGMNEAETAAAIAKMREYFAPKGIFENELYPGIPELLADTAAAGCVNVMATSKPEPFARRIAEHFDIARPLPPHRRKRPRRFAHLEGRGDPPRPRAVANRPGGGRHDRRPPLRHRGCRRRRPRLRSRRLGIRRTRGTGGRTPRPFRRGCRGPAAAVALNPSGTALFSPKTAAIRKI